MDELYIQLSKNRGIIYKKEGNQFIKLRISGEEEVIIDDIESILELKEYLIKTYFDFNEESHNLKVKIIYDYSINRQLLGNFISIFLKKVDKEFYTEEKILHNVEAINIESFEKTNLFLTKDTQEEIEENEEEKIDEIFYEEKIKNLEQEIKNLKKENRDLRISMIKIEKEYKLKLLDIDSDKKNTINKQRKS